MDSAEPVHARATGEWLRGDVIQALVTATELDREVYRVRGLDEDGHPAGRAEKAFNALFSESAGEYVAVLRLRDRAKGTASQDAFEAVKEEKTVGGALRGLGKFVTASAAEFAKSVRRPPLHERPDDAVLECPFELPRAALARVEKWKQPLVPQFRGGPHWLAGLLVGTGENRRGRAGRAHRFLGLSRCGERPVTSRTPSVGGDT